MADAFRAFDVGAGTGIPLGTGSEYGRNSNGIVDLAESDNRPQSPTQVLVDAFNSKSLGGRGAKVLPIRPSFPAFGPSLFFVSELTAENHAPALEFNYQRDKKEGGK